MKERAKLFERQPLCVECERRGFVREATERDHIVALADGGPDVAENTQALCADCHAEKSRAEMARRAGGVS